MTSKSGHVTKSNATQEHLKSLRDTHGLSYRQIAQIQKFKGIPLQTLSAIYHGKRDVPKKYRKQLGEPELTQVEVCPQHGIPHCWDCQTQTVSAKREKKPKRKWSDLSIKDLRWALENRHEPYWRIER